MIPGSLKSHPGHLLAAIVVISILTGVTVVGHTTGDREQGRGASGATLPKAQSQKPAKPAKPQQPATQTSRLLITGARILDAEAGKYLPAAAILIERGRITSVTANPPPALPPDVTVLALKDVTIVPGLVDAHAWAAPTDDLDADYFYLLGLANGVTGYRVINVRTAWGVAQRGRSASGTFDAPAIATSGRGIDQAASFGRWLFDAPDATSAAEEVARQVEAGVDWIAAYENVAPETYRAMAGALRGKKVRLSGLPGASSMADLAASGVQSIETLAYPIQQRKNGNDEAWLAATSKELATLAASLVRARVTLVPMLAAARARAYPEEALKDESLEWLPEARRKSFTDAVAALDPAALARAQKAWAIQAEFLNRFVRAGGKIATGTGFEVNRYPVPGVGVQREIAALVQAGLKPADAIRAATVNGARLIGAPTGAVGIKPGVQANLIVVQGDPLANAGDLARITSVIRAGRVLDPKDLLAQARASVVTRSK